MPPYGRSKAKKQKRSKMPMEDMMMPGGMPKHMMNKRQMEKAMGRKKMKH